jgi:hypothetical protein
MQVGKNCVRKYQLLQDLFDVIPNSIAICAHFIKIYILAHELNMAFFIFKRILLKIKKI